MLRHVVLGTLKTINETVFTAGTASYVRVNSFWLTNASSSDDNCSLYHVPSGQAASTSNALFFETTVTANTSVVVDPAGVVMEPGDKIVASSTTGGRLVVHAYLDVVS